MASCRAFNEENEEQEFISQNQIIFNQLLQQTRTPNLLKQTKAETYDPEVFIDEIQGFPCLWNTSSRSHHNAIMRQTCWDQLSKKFGKPG